PPAASAPPTLPPPPGQIVPPPGIITPPPGLTPPRAVTPPVAPAEPPAQFFAPLVTAPPVPAPASPVADAVGDGSDDLDRTVVVDRRPVVPWRLLVDGGPVFRLSGTRVVLGRRPNGGDAGAQEIAVPDPTRTLSKVHARLDLIEGVWTVTDLDATNGVIVIEADGTENLLDPGASAPVVDRFVLGKVGMRLAFGEDDASR
uniref:FHA domain-containing protein n=1 Tax=Pseudolysinimonas sp. TaxID=2680009 RepID=UPI00378512BA